MINETIIKRAIEETDGNLNLNHTEIVKKKPTLDNVTILEYVAKSFALLGRKVKSSMSKNKKKTGKLLLLNYRLLCGTYYYANFNETKDNYGKLGNYK